MKLSVIVPIYNVEKYLARCLDSIKHQAFTDFECIMVNDGSTDSSEQICKKYLTDSRFKLITQKNAGQSTAKNNGLANCHGEYIAFVDSDDWIDVSMFLDMVMLIEKTGSDVACCDYCLVYDYKHIRQPKLRVQVLKSPDSIVEFLKAGNGGAKNNYSSCNKVYRKDIFKYVSFPQGRLYDDMSFSAEIFLNAKRVVYTNQVYYFYFQKNISITRNALTARMLDLILETEKILNLFSSSDKKTKKLAENIQTRSYFSLLVRLCISSDYPKDVFTDLVISNWIKILRNNFWQMIFSCMDLKRKITYLFLCVNYKFVGKAYRFFNKVTSESLPC